MNKRMYLYFNNPDKEAFHEAGHILATYLLTGGFNRASLFAGNPSMDNQAGYWKIFRTVCIEVAGAVAEGVHLFRFRGMPKNSMVEDLDHSIEFAKNVWHLRFKENRAGFMVCPVLDNMVKTATDFVEAQFRSSKNIAILRQLAEYLKTYDIVLPRLFVTLENPQIYEMIGHEFKILGICEGNFIFCEGRLKICKGRLPKIKKAIKALNEPTAAHIAKKMKKYENNKFFHTFRR